MLSELPNLIVDWFRQHAWLVWVGFGLTLTTLLASVFVVPWAIVRIRCDYFTHRCRPQAP